MLYKLQVFEAADVLVQSKDIVDDVSRMQESNSILGCIQKNLSDDLIHSVQYDKLYNFFEVGLTGLEVRHGAFFCFSVFYSFNIYVNKQQG
jgi:hypothetical protein